MSDLTASSPRVTCKICDDEMPLLDIIRHLFAEHGIDAEPETWPDGAPVVVDQTLEIEDFTPREPSRDG